MWLLSLYSHRNYYPSLPFSTNVFAYPLCSYYYYYYSKKNQSGDYYPTPTTTVFDF